MSQFTKVLESLTVLKKQYEEQAQVVFKQVFTDFFSKYPQCKTIQWRQYAPHFNDGDACEFGVHAPCFSPMAHDEITDDPEGEEGEDAEFLAKETYERQKYKKVPVDKPKTQHWGQDYTYVPDGFETILADARTTPEMRTDMWALSSALQDELSDACYAAFGDGYTVKAHKDGFEVEEYQHE